MKKSYFIQALCFLGLLSCDYGDKFDGFKEDLVGGTVQAVYVSPSSYTLYIVAHEVFLWKLVCVELLNKSVDIVVVLP